MKILKAVILGDTECGKTSFTTRYTTGNFPDPNFLRTTIGASFDTKKITTASGNDVTLSIWDFGGQEYYHGTFRLFLSNFAVYILLWETDTNKNDVISTEVREAESEELQHYHYKYWLDNIRHFAPDSPILIVQNKVDKDQRQRISTTWIDEYNIFGDHHISLHEAAKTGTSKYKWSFDTFCNDLSECFEEILKKNILLSLISLDIRYHSRFFVQVGHKFTHAAIGNHIFY